MGALGRALGRCFESLICVPELAWIRRSDPSRRRMSIQLLPGPRPAGAATSTNGSFASDVSTGTKERGLQLASTMAAPSAE